MTTDERNLPARFWKWAVESEGSTRPAAIIRIGLALLIWARFGSEVSLAHNPNLLRVGLILVFTPAVTLMLLGWKTRWSTLASASVVGAMNAYAILFPERSAWFSHHVTLLAFATFLCALMPSGRSLSLDRWLALRQAEQGGFAPPPERGNLWAQRLLAIQVAIVYFFAAADKTHWGYLDGSRLEATFMAYLFGSQYPDWLPGYHELCVALSWGTLAVEYGLAFGLFLPRLRWWCSAAGVVFHAAIYLTIPVATFSATMILLYVAFLDPDEVHSQIDRMLGHEPLQVPSASQAGQSQRIRVAR